MWDALALAGVGAGCWMAARGGGASRFTQAGLGLALLAGMAVVAARVSGVEGSSFARTAACFLLGLGAIAGSLSLTLGHTRDDQRIGAVVLSAVANIVLVLAGRYGLAVGLSAVVAAIGGILWRRPAAADVPPSDSPSNVPEAVARLRRVIEPGLAAVVTLLIGLALLAAAARLSVPARPSSVSGTRAKADSVSQDRPMEAMEGSGASTLTVFLMTAIVVVAGTIVAAREPVEESLAGPSVPDSHA